MGMRLGIRLDPLYLTIGRHGSHVCVVHMHPMEIEYSKPKGARELGVWLGLFLPS